MPEQDASGGGLFGRIAVKQRFVTQVRLNECLKEQQELAEQGHNKRIGDLFVERGYLTEDQRQAIIEMQKKVMGPKQLGGFELIEKIAEGGMGAVYRARQVSLDRVVALKILPERFAKDEAFVARFYREAKTAAKLDHPHIVRALDVGQAEGKHYFAMEFIEGKSLGDILEKEGMLPEPRAVNYMLQIAGALEHAWDHQLIHRDVKPDNILIAKGDVAKLADLGLARSTVDESTRVTQTGTAMGTPHYISPEQARGEADIDIRTDIYSLGATLYHLVTGTPPYEGTTAAVIITKHLTETPPSARAKNAQVSEGLDAVIRKMMAKNREDRYVNPNEVIRDLEAIAKGAGKALGLTLMDASQLDFARAASMKEAEALRRAPTVPTMARAAPTALIWGAIVGGGAVLVAAVVILLIVLSGPSKERVRAARTELNAIESRMNQKKWDEAARRSADALKEFEDVKECQPAFERCFKEAEEKAKELGRLRAEAETEETRIKTLMDSRDWETAHRRAKDAVERFRQLEEKRALFASFAEKADKEAEKERKRRQRLAEAEAAREEVQKLWARGKPKEAIAKAKKGAEDYADLPIARKFSELQRSLEDSVRDKYEAVFAKGTKAFSEGRYPETILHMQEALTLRPESPAAKSVLNNARNKIELGKARDLVRDGDAILARKDYAGAVAKYEQAIADFGRLVEAGAGAEAVSGKKAAERKRDDALALRKCSELIRKARALENSRDWERALSEYVKAYDYARGDLVEEVAQRKQKVEEEIAYLKAMRRAKANEIARRWKEVIQACEEALTKKPTSTEAKTLLAKAKREGLKEKATQELARVSGLIDSRRYDEAITAANRGVERYAETPYISEFKRLAEKAKKLQADERRTAGAERLRSQIDVVRDEIRRLREEEKFALDAELAAVRDRLRNAEGKLRELAARSRKPARRPEPRAGTSTTGPAGTEFVYVPSGTFAMGSESGDGDEMPAQQISVDGFYIGKFEITNAQYEKYDSFHASLRSKWSRGDSDPAVHVTWYDASRFCLWLRTSDPGKALYRLPTEAEWEYAARGTDGRVYPWGNSPRPSEGSSGCNYKDDGRADRNRFCSPVGSFPSGASPFGCMDMAGNVWEWCLSWYSPDYYYSIPRHNPAGPSDGTAKAVRGGSWNNPLRTCRSSNRAPLKPTIRNANTGFRVVRIERD